MLCYGIDPDDHARLQERAVDVESCAEYLQERGIVAALAHPFWEVEEPLTLRHRHRLAQLFPIWEVRSGYFGTAFNAPALAFREACGGVGIGGSDDHGGIHTGLTYTETPSAGSPQEFLACPCRSRQAGREPPETCPGDGGNRAAQPLPGGLGRAAGALSRAPRVRPRMAPAPEPAEPEPLPDVVGL